MKYYPKLFSQFKINITTPMSRTSLFSCYTTIMSYFIISYIMMKPLFIFCRHEKVFIKIPFYRTFAIIIIFKNCFNESINCILFLCKEQLACYIYYQYKQLYKQNSKEYVIDIFQCMKHYFYHYS